MEGTTPAPAAERPRLNLKPRDEQAARLAEQQRQEQLKQKVRARGYAAHLPAYRRGRRSPFAFLSLPRPQGNPFGTARPREAILAEKLGKSEEELLAEEARKQRLHLRLNAQQVEEKRAAEAAIAEASPGLLRLPTPPAPLKSRAGLSAAAPAPLDSDLLLRHLQAKAALEGEADAAKRPGLEADLRARESALEDLMAKFEAMTVEKVQSGEVVRPSEIKRLQPAAQPAPPPVSSSCPTPLCLPLLPPLTCLPLPLSSAACSASSLLRPTWTCC